MKAVYNPKFGPATNLKIIEREIPEPKKNELLIKVKATSVTSSDCNMRNSSFVTGFFKFMGKLFLIGIFRPRIKFTGIEFAGDVVKTGSTVTRFKTGDRVFGSSIPRFGSHAEYVLVSEEGAITFMPEKSTYEEAAVLSVMGTTALYYLTELSEIKPGMKVLVNGASGGIGTYAVQILKHLGAEVTGVCSASNVKLVSSLGADYVIDYTKNDFISQGKSYDIIFDVVGKTSYRRCKGILNKGGSFLTALMDFQDVKDMLSVKKSTGHKVKGGAAPDSAEYLEKLKTLYIKKAIKPVIGKTMLLDNIVEAFTYVESWRKVGNLVIKV